MTVEIAGLVALWSFRKLLRVRINLVSPSLQYQIVMNRGMSFAANVASITSMVACLKPAEIDSSLIFPATMPMM